MVSNLDTFSARLASFLVALCKDDETELLRLVREHRVASLVGPLLKNHSLLLDKPDLSRELSELVEENKRRVQRQFFMLAQIESAFERANLSYVVVKGLPLAKRLYVDLSCRHNKDIDLLVTMADLESARDVLIELGLHPNFHFGADNRASLPSSYKGLYLQRNKDFTFYGHGIAVELHVRLASWSVPATNHYEQLALSGVAAETDLLKAELLYLCYHGASFGLFSRLKWLLDIALYLQLPCVMEVGFQNDLRKLAIQLNSLRSLILSWQLASHVFGVELPAWVQQETAKDRVVQTLSNRAIAQFCTDKTTFSKWKVWWFQTKNNQFVRAALTPRPSEKLQIIIHHFLCPTPADLYLFRFIPVQLHVLHWLLRPFSVIFRKLRPLKQTLY